MDTPQKKNIILLNMKKIWRHTMGLYFYGSFHIGIGAMAMTFMTFHNLGSEATDYMTYLLAVFFGTICFYSFHRIYDLNTIAHRSGEPKYELIIALFKPIRIITIVAGFLAAVCFFFIPFKAQLIVSISALITIWYSIPIGSKLKKLKEFPHIKIFLIALIWGTLTSGIPSILYGEAVSSIILLTMERSVFIFALTLPFDVRDYMIDQRSRIMTIPIWMGKNRSLVLSVFLIVFIQTLLLWIINAHGILSFQLTLCLFFTNLFVSFFVGLSAKVENDFYYTGLLDGMLILQPIFLIFICT